jgi:hypothetical protein
MVCLRNSWSLVGGYFLKQLVPPAEVIKRRLCVIFRNRWSRSLCSPPANYCLYVSCLVSSPSSPSPPHAQLPIADQSVGRRTSTALDVRLNARHNVIIHAR